jgi:hypothetical protein
MIAQDWGPDWKRSRVGEIEGVYDFTNAPDQCGIPTPRSITSQLIVTDIPDRISLKRLRNFITVPHWRTDQVMLQSKDITSAFRVGEVVTGAVSGAQGTIVSGQTRVVAGRRQGQAILSKIPSARFLNEDITGDRGGAALNVWPFNDKLGWRNRVIPDHLVPAAIKQALWDVGRATVTWTQAKDRLRRRPENVRPQDMTDNDLVADDEVEAL